MVRVLDEDGDGVVGRGKQRWSRKGCLSRAGNQAREGEEARAGWREQMKLGELEGMSSL